LLDAMANPDGKNAQMIRAMREEQEAYARGEVTPLRLSARESAPGDWAVFNDDAEPADWNNCRLE
jgi:hypothetical protein